MDKSEEMPMLAVVLTISGILAIVCFFLLFSVRKKVDWIEICYLDYNFRNMICSFLHINPIIYLFFFVIHLCTQCNLPLILFIKSRNSYCEDEIIRMVLCMLDMNGGGKWGR